MTDAKSPVQGTNVLLLMVGLAGVSLSGPAMAAATAVPALAFAMWRTGLAALAIAPGAMTRHRADLAALPRREWVRSLFAGLMLAGHFATWVTALRFTSVAAATALVCGQVAWVVVLARLAGRRIERGVVTGLVVALVGVLVVSGVDLTVSTRALVGDALAIAGGMFGAVYITVGGRVRTQTSTTAYTLICYASCALLLLGACLVGAVPLVGYNARSWVLIAVVTVMAQLLGHSVFNHLLAVMSPTVVSMVLLLEVPGAALLAAVFLGQAPPTAVYAGLALICAGLALVLRARSVADIPREAPLD